jgi:hypothetical protein
LIRPASTLSLSSNNTIPLMVSSNNTTNTQNNAIFY